MLKASLEPCGRLILVDNVRRWPVIPRNACAFIAKACLKFPADLFRHGHRSAWRIFRFRTSRHWLNHVLSDHIPSSARFRETYAAALPGAMFTPMKYYIGVMWQAPGSAEQND